MMKLSVLFKTIPLLLLMVCLLWGCQNDIIFEPVLETDGTCSDGVQNADETGIDCGGRCTECELVFVPAPCRSSLKDNVLQFLGKDHAFYRPYMDEYNTPYTVKSDFDRYGSYYTEFMLQLPLQSEPEVSEVFRLGPDVVWSDYTTEHRAYLEIFFDGFDGGTYKSTEKGLIYVEVADGQTTIEFCEVELTTSSGFTLVYSGRVIL